jgi:hypothetical protein
MRRHREAASWTALSGVALADNGAGLIRVTATSHGLSTGFRVHVKEVSGVPANGTWYVTVIDANNFDLQGSTFSGAHSSGTGAWLLAPLFGWAYQYSLPSGWLRIVNLNGYEANENDSIPHAIEDGKILCDSDTIEMRFVHRITATSNWPQTFINAFSFLLASYIAQDLTGPGGKAAEMRARYEQAIAPLARTHDSRQGKGRVIDPWFDSPVIQARRGGRSLP